MRTCLGVGQGVMVVLKVEAAGCRDGLELVVGQAAAEMAAGSQQRIVEAIIRIIHLIDAMDGLEAALVETRVMCHQRQPLDHRGDLFPHVRKYRRLVRVTRPQPVHPLAEPLIVFRLRMDQRIEGVDNLAAPHDHHADAAYA